MTGIYFPGWTYDRLIGNLLRNVRIRIAETIRRHDLFPFLDICCGTGAQCRVLNSDDAHLVSGIDINRRLLAYGRNQNPGIHFVCADAKRLPYAHDAFQGIAITYGLHDKSLVDQREILKESARVLAPGGKGLIFEFENPGNMKARCGCVFTSIIELTAGKRHYRNGRDFLRRGGIGALMKEMDFTTRMTWEFPWGHSRLILFENAEKSRPS